MKHYSVMTSTHTTENKDGPFLIASEVYGKMIEWLNLLIEADHTINENEDNDKIASDMLCNVIRDMTNNLPEEEPPHDQGLKDRIGGLPEANLNIPMP